MRSREILFNFLFYLIELFIWRGTFGWKLHLNQTSGSKVMYNWTLKTTENNRKKFIPISHINTPDFRLIPLDHNTYYVQSHRNYTVSSKLPHSYFCIEPMRHVGVGSDRTLDSQQWSRIRTKIHGAAEDSTLWTRTSLWAWTWTQCPADSDLSSSHDCWIISNTAIHVQ